MVAFGRSWFGRRAERGGAERQTARARPRATQQKYVEIINYFIIIAILQPFFVSVLET